MQPVGAKFEPCSLADSAEPLDKAEFDRVFVACVYEAKVGNPISQKNLAYIYYFGNRYVERDLAESKKWFNAAANHGNEMAIARLKELNSVAVLNSPVR